MFLQRAVILKRCHVSHCYHTFTLGYFEVCHFVCLFFFYTHVYSYILSINEIVLVFSIQLLLHHLSSWYKVGRQPVTFPHTKEIQLLKILVPTLPDSWQINLQWAIRTVHFNEGVLQTEVQTVVSRAVKNAPPDLNENRVIMHANTELIFIQ